MNFSFKKTETNLGPYLGTTNKLIDAFYILGYDENYLKENYYNQIIENKGKKIPETNLFSIQINQNPNIISVISKINSNQRLEKHFPDFCFPNYPNLFYCNNLYDDIPNKKYIHGANQPLEANNIKYLFTYTFYEKDYINNLIIYIPKFFIIISGYPFFIFFKYISEQILIQFKNNKLEIPLEIQIYNIINFIPSPISNNQILKIFPYYELSEYKKIDNENDFLRLNKMSEYFLSQFTGYPIIDLNINEIFKLITPNTLVIIYIMFIGNEKLLLFGDNDEYINCVMKILVSLFFPNNVFPFPQSFVAKSEIILSDDIINDLIEHIDNIFFGFQLNFEENKDSIVEEQYPFNELTIGLNNQLNRYSANLKRINQEEEIEKSKFIKDLYGLFDRKKDKNKEKNEFNEIIINFYNNLKKVSTQINVESKIDFLNISEKQKELNLLTQRYIYEFYVDFYNMIYNNLMRKYMEKKTFDLKNGNDISNYNLDLSLILEENTNEVLFPELNKIYSKMLKSNVVFETFTQLLIDFNRLNKYLLTSYIFLEEFICLKNIKKKFNENIDIDYLDIIFDCFNVRENNKKETKYVHFLNFYKFYEGNNEKVNESLKYKIFSNINNSHIEKTIKKTPISTKYFYKYNSVELDNNILLNYINNLNNTKINLSTIFPYKNLNEQEYIPKKIYEESITDLIESYLIRKNNLNYKYLIQTSIFLFFSIILDNIKLENYIDLIHELLLLLNFNPRKYIFKLSYLYYKICEKNPIFISEKKCIFELENLLNKLKIFAIGDLKILIKEINNLNNSTNEKVNNSMLDNLYLNYKEAISQLYSCYIQSRIGRKLNSNILDNFLKDNSYDDFIYLSNATFKLTSKNLKNTLISDIYSPIKLFKTCNNLYNQFLENLNINSLDKNVLISVIINLLFYSELINLNKNINNFLFAALVYLTMLI